MSVSLRRATDEDVSFIAGLVAHEDVAPYLAAVRPSSEEEIAAELARSMREPEDLGVLVIELDGDPVGTATWERVNRRSRIASVGGFAVDAHLRGRGIGTEAALLLQRYLIRELGFHRLQMEIYGFNVRAQRHAERAGWVREGVRRKAYWRNDTWVDGVLYGLVEEDLDPP
jgi:RimJ/RimL family protein N-acetyltransferase